MADGSNLSPDGQYLYAAVADVGADVVMYDGLL